MCFEYARISLAMHRAVLLNLRAFILQSIALKCTLNGILQRLLASPVSSRLPIHCRDAHFVFASGTAFDSESVLAYVLK